MPKIRQVDKQKDLQLTRYKNIKQAISDFFQISNILV